MNKVKGKIIPIRDHVLITDMTFEEQRTKSGIIIQSDDGKSEGIKPRWGRVWAVGPAQKDVKVGEWILVEHGRWTRGFDLEDEEGNITTIRRVDTNNILMSADNKPEGPELSGEYTTAQHGSTHNAADFVNMKQI